MIVFFRESFMGGVQVCKYKDKDGNDASLVLKPSDKGKEITLDPAEEQDLMDKYPVLFKRKPDYDAEKAAIKARKEKEKKLRRGE